MEINGYQLECTCYACPEQYDVHLDGNRVGYLRLRHGYFSAENQNSQLVYSSRTKGDGVFDDDEREYHLTKAIEAITKDRQQQHLAILDTMDSLDHVGLMTHIGDKNNLEVENRALKDAIKGALENLDFDNYDDKFAKRILLEIMEKYGEN